MRIALAQIDTTVGQVAANEARIDDWEWGRRLSAAMLPESFRVVLHLNPIYYMIEAMRFALIGHTVERPWAGFSVMAGIAAILVGWALWLLRRGYKLRA